MPRGSYELLALPAAHIEKRRMSKVRINDLAREIEVKSRQVLDLLTKLGLGDPKMTHSSSIEDHEAEKVRAHFGGARGSAGSSRTPQGLQPKVDLSNISKPGDALKAILARKQEQEDAARRSHAPVKPAAVATAPAPAARPAAVAVPEPRPEANPAPRKIVPAPRQAPNIVIPSTPAIASRPPAAAVVAKAPIGAAVATAARPAVATAPPSTVVVRPPVVVAPKPGVQADRSSFAGKAPESAQAQTPARPAAAPQPAQAPKVAVVSPSVAPVAETPFTSVPAPVPAPEAKAAAPIVEAAPAAAAPAPGTAEPPRLLLQRPPSRPRLR